jgi:hypothetical protein
MREDTRGRLQDYILELERRAAKSQGDARRTLNPLFTRDDNKRPPRDFVDSSFMYMRSCDADTGSRPIPCPVFWLSPDLRVAPLSNLGMPTQSLIAGTTYRFTATVRNRGDLPVPSAKVEFYLVNPSLGFDTRFATKLGVAAGRVQSYGASEISIDYTVPPSLAGHRCLFARVFSFSPLDLPLDDYALSPVYDRHIAQLNLNIVANGAKLLVDWFHLPNADETLELTPMAAPMIRALRLEAVTAFTIVSGTLWRRVAGQVEFDVQPAEGPRVAVERTGEGLQLTSHDPEAVGTERQADLNKRAISALRALETGRADHGKFAELFRERRAMNAQGVRTQVTLALPRAELKDGQALALNMIRRSRVTGEALGGIGMLIAG